MIPNDKIKFILKNDIKTSFIKRTKDELDKGSGEKSGETKIIPTDITKLVESVHGEEPLTNTKDNSESKGTTEGTTEDTKVISETQKKDSESTVWTTNINIKNFITETLREAGVKFNDSVVDQLFVAVIQAMLDGKLDIKTDITSVTALIDMNLRNGSTLDGLDCIQSLINNILNQSDAPCQSTTKDVKTFILEAFEKINKENKDNNTIPGNVDPGTNNPNPNINPDPDPNVNPDPDPNVNPDPDPYVNPDPVDPNSTEPTVVDTPEKAMQVLSNLIDNTSYTENTSIKDFLLQFKFKASQYIQMQFGYEAQFADVIAMFLANAVSETSGADSGLMKDVELSAIKEKFLNFIQDMSFVDTTNGVTARSKQSGKEGNIEYIRAYVTEDGYSAVGRGSDNLYIHGNDDMTYGKNGELNNGVFLRFLLSEYLQNDIYEGRLNDSQLALIMEKVIKEFGGTKASKYKDTDTYCILLYTNRTALDKSPKNGSFFDELLAAILKVSQTIKNVDTDNLTSINLDELFGNKESLSAAQIHSNENNYLISNDPGIRAIMSALIDASNKYNVTNNVDYLDFLNVFIKMIYEKCGKEVVTDKNGNPLLTKDIMQNYINKFGVQSLKDFAESIELRNAYYMENFIQTDGINEEIEDFNQGQTGDCYLLSALQSLSLSEYGRELIHNMIRQNPDGSYTVTLKGGYSKKGSYEDAKYTNWCAKVTEYTFSLDQIFEARATGLYSKGDWDVLLIEMAISKLIKEQAYTEDYVPNRDGDPYLYGGNLKLVMHLLTGSRGRKNKTPGNLEFKNFVLNNIANGTINEDNPIGNYAMYISIGSHAYAITKVTTEGIIYCDPYHPEIENFVSWDDFINSVDSKGNRKYMVSYCPLF